MVSRLLGTESNHSFVDGSSSLASKCLILGTRLEGSKLTNISSPRAKSCTLFLSTCTRTAGLRTSVKKSPVDEIGRCGKHVCRLGAPPRRLHANHRNRLPTQAAHSRASTEQTTRNIAPSLQFDSDVAWAVSRFCHRTAERPLGEVCRSDGTGCAWRISLAGASVPYRNDLSFAEGDYCGKIACATFVQPFVNDVTDERRAKGRRIVGSARTFEGLSRSTELI
mgnify:CR=1 FL=1